MEYYYIKAIYKGFSRILLGCISEFCETFDITIF